VTHPSSAVVSSAHLSVLKLLMTDLQQLMHPADLQVRTLSFSPLVRSSDTEYEGPHSHKVSAGSVQLGRSDAIS
jgi:hypothetical protein